MNTQHHRDEELWQVAKARVNFRWSLACYFIINAMLVAIWFFSKEGIKHHFWPIWSIMGWGVGIAFQYFHAYHGNKFISATEEYEKLKKQEDSNY